MSAISGTGVRTDFKGARESLSDKIYNIDPHETLFLSMIGVGPAAKAVTEEWQIDSYAAAVTTNAVAEGDQFSYTTPTATTRLGNICQISRKTVSISRTQDRILKAGRASELAMQVAKRGVEMKKDIESTCLANQAADTGDPRKIAALPAWLKTNTNFYTTDGADPTYTSGVPVGTRTDGTLRAFTETIHKDVLQQMWVSGAKPKVVMVGPVNKQKVSATFNGLATRTIDLANAAAKPMAAVAAIDVYVGDFHTVRIVPNRLQRERDAWYLDPEFLEIRYLDPIQTVNVAKLADAEQRALIAEWTLVVKNEAAEGAAFDLTTTA